MGIIGVISQSPVEAGQASTSSSNIGLMIVPELLARGIGRVAHSGDLPESLARDPATAHYDAALWICVGFGSCVVIRLRQITSLAPELSAHHAR